MYHLSWMAARKRSATAALMTAALIAAGCDRPSGATAPPDTMFAAHPPTVGPTHAADPALAALRQQLVDPWSARTWRENFGATTPDLLESPQRLLRLLRGDHPATIPPASNGHVSLAITQQQADASLSGVQTIDPVTGTITVTVRSEPVAAAALGADGDFGWKYMRADGSVVNRTPGDSPFHCSDGKGTRYDCVVHSRYYFKCEADHARIGGDVLTTIWGAYVLPVVTSRHYVGPTTNWVDCPPPPPPPGTSGGYTDECWVCQEWLDLYNGEVIDDWWECALQTGQVCLAAQ
jgi:hypothetical protein